MPFLALIRICKLLTFPTYVPRKHCARCYNPEEQRDRFQWITDVRLAAHVECERGSMALEGT